MPFIRVTVPGSMLDEAQRAEIAERLTVEIMKIETGGHDTPGVRAISALILEEMPPGSWAIGGILDAGPAAVVEIRVPEGALNERRRASMVEASHEVLTKVSPQLASVDGVRRIWTHLVEVRDGHWGAGDRIVHLADVQRIALEMPA
jgi:phenylpyruvate tautomerase PptA (4-oxalocrotonate tautomerase family)